jgi:hypothetical protein
MVIRWVIWWCGGGPPAEVGLNGFHIRVGGRFFGGIS